MEKIELGTTDITQENIEKIIDLFPQVATEVKTDGEVSKVVDFDALRELLGDVAEGQRERYQFTWPGKREAKAEARRPIAKTLRPCKEKSKNWDDTENLYIEGDNLDALKILRETYAGKVKMIYIDPPYNTGHDFVYDDDFAQTRGEYDGVSGDYDDEGGRLVANTEGNGRFHSDWCSMMYPRLLLAKDLLAPDGVLFISIGDAENRNLKNICDEIFGESNFVNCFIWNCSTAGGIRPKFASETHEYVYCYAHNKDRLGTFYAPLSDDALKMYTQSNHRGRYRDKDFVFKNKSNNENQKYGIECPDGEVVYPKSGYIYRFVRERFDEALELGDVTFKKTNTGPLVTEDGKQASWNIYIKKYLGDAKGAPATLIPKEKASLYNAGTKCVQDFFDNACVFENVKPSNLIEWLLGLPSKQDGIILDFFSGSATTAQSVIQMNADDDGHRKFIMVQIPEPCNADSDARKAGYETICDIGEERIRRAGAKIAFEIEESNRQLEIGQDPKLVPDIGFRVLRVDSSNFRDTLAEPGALDQSSIFDYVDNLKEGRTSEDLLFQVLPKFRIPYSAKIEEVELAGKSCFVVEDGQLVACFDPEVGVETIEAIAKMQPLYAVMRDASMADDSTFANFEELFKTYSPDTVRRVI